MSQQRDIAVLKKLLYDRRQAIINDRTVISSVEADDVIDALTSAISSIRRNTRITCPECDAEIDLD
jgi:hypothetical protein